MEKEEEEEAEEEEEGGWVWVNGGISPCPRWICRRRRMRKVREGGREGGREGRGMGSDVVM